ncbi:MAG: cache domain-containing protein [Anaerolineae bacterium]
MRTIWVWNVRRKLLAFSAAVIAPVVILAYLLVQQNVSYTRSQILDSSFAAADILGSHVDTFIEDSERLLNTLAQFPALKARDPVRTNSLFIDTLPQQPSFLNLFAAHEDGRVFAAVIWRGEDPRSLAGMDEFHYVMTSGRTAISGRRISRSTGEVAVSVVVPLRDDAGRLVGALGADISLKRLQEALANIDAAQRATVIVTDRRGLVLVHPNYHNVYQETSLADLPPVAAALQGQAGTLKYMNPQDQQTWLAAYRPMHRTGWPVVVAHSASSVGSLVQGTWLRGLAALGVVTLLAVAISLFSARTITRPLDQLTTAARDIARGDLNQQVHVRTRDELEKLADAFNLMSHSLAQNVTDLAEAKEEISHKAAELQRLLAHTVHVQEEDRRRIAMDIHDGVTQLLVGALFQVQTAQAVLAADPAQATACLQDAQRLLNESVAEMRRAIFDLRPHILDHLGLAPALQHYIQDYHQHGEVPCSLEVIGAPIRLPDDQEMGIYRIVQEALQNVAKHAQASSVRVRIEFAPAQVQVTVRDDGTGFEQGEIEASHRTSLGLIDIRERAQSIGGQLEIESAPGQGTQVRLRLALDGRGPDEPVCSKPRSGAEWHRGAGL